MRLLLYTHAMYWYIEGDLQLSGPARTWIQDGSNEILISPASYWEMAIKISIGKWRLNQPYEDFIELAIDRYGFQILPIMPPHTARLIQLPYLPGHKDPFDRLIVAQALVEQVPIVSADATLDRYGVPRLW